MLWEMSLFVVRYVASRRKGEPKKTAETRTMAKAEVAKRFAPETTFKTPTGGPSTTTTCVTRTPAEVRTMAEKR